jgi:hypothetical protein
MRRHVGSWKAWGNSGTTLEDSRSSSLALAFTRLWAAALLTQKTFERLYQIVTIHRFYGLSRRRFGLL